jgi:hypothetical protein
VNAPIQGGVPVGEGPEPKELPAGRPASADALEPIITDRDDGVPFDADAAREQALQAFRDAEGDEEETLERAPKPEEEKKPAAPEPEPDEEDEHAKKLREELTEKDGKLSQDKLERAFASLTKQEKRLKNKVKALGQEREVFVGERERVAALQKEIETERATLAARRDKAKSKPLEALTELGWSYEDLVKYVMQDGKIPPEKLVADMKAEQARELQEQKKELDALKTDIEKSKVIAAGTDYERKLRANIADLHPAYRYVSKYPVEEVQDLVLQIQVQHWEENQKLPAGKQKTIDSKEILDMLENRQAEIVKRLGLESGQAGAPSANPGTAKSKTLTNEVTAERGRKPAESDETPFDREAALEEARRSLRAG